MKHCDECHKDGEPLVNNRNQERCRHCYSLRLSAIPDPVVIEQDYPLPDDKPRKKAKGK